jgi:serine/threonine protein kinase
MSKKLNQNGNVVNLNETKNGVPFFRKTNSSALELAIARKIKNNPHPNIVKIYHVGDTYFDMELLNTNVSRRNCIENKKDLIKAKNHLHKNGIVYLDWKPDNMGISLATGKIKVFDFDMSALLRRRLWYINNWKLAPNVKGYLRRNAENAGMTTPLKIDNWIFNEKFMK